MRVTIEYRSDSGAEHTETITISDEHRDAVLELMRPIRRKQSVNDQPMPRGMMAIISNAEHVAKGLGVLSGLTDEEKAAVERAMRKQAERGWDKMPEIGISEHQHFNCDWISVMVNGVEINPPPPIGASLCGTCGEALVICGNQHLEPTCNLAELERREAESQQAKSETWHDREPLF